MVSRSLHVKKIVWGFIVLCTQEMSHGQVHFLYCIQVISHNIHNEHISECVKYTVITFLYIFHCPDFLFNPVSEMLYEIKFSTVNNIQKLEL